MVTVLVPRENSRTLNSNTDSILAILPNLTVRKKYPETHFLKVVTYQLSLEIKVLKPLASYKVLPVQIGSNEWKNEHYHT